MDWIRILLSRCGDCLSHRRAIAKRSDALTDNGTRATWRGARAARVGSFNQQRCADILRRLHGLPG
jgi:hypothetical protein